MSQNKLINYVEPPKDLLDGILLKIERRKRRDVVMSLAASSFGALFSATTLVSLFSYTAESFYQSGVFSFVSVLFSEPSAAFSYFGDLALSIAESLPSFEIAILLLTIFVFLKSFAYIVEGVNNLSLKNNLA